MKVRWSRSVVLLLALPSVLYLVPSSPVQAWSPVAHYYIAKEASLLKAVPPGVEEYASLPDYEENRYHWFVPPIGVMRALWCWSHGTQGAGSVLSGPIRYPKKPTYPDDGRYPGQDQRDNRYRSSCCR